MPPAWRFLRSKFMSTSSLSIDESMDGPISPPSSQLSPCSSWADAPTAPSSRRADSSRQPQVRLQVQLERQNSMEDDSWVPPALPRLHDAAFYGNVEAVVRELVDGGADINEQCCHVNLCGDLVAGVTPLYLAAQQGHRGVCSYLLRRGADARVTSGVCDSPETFTPADVALTQGHVRVWWLLRAAARRQRKQQR